MHLMLIMWYHGSLNAQQGFFNFMFSFFQLITPETPKRPSVKRVRFFNQVAVILIPSRNEYVDAGLAPNIWDLDNNSSSVLEACKNEIQAYYQEANAKELCALKQEKEQSNRSLEKLILDRITDSYIANEFKEKDITSDLNELSLQSRLGLGPT